MKIFKKCKLIVLSCLIGLTLVPNSSFAASSQNVAARATLLQFPTGISTNFNNIIFKGYLSQEEWENATYKLDQTTVSNPTYKVVAATGYNVYIAADKLSNGVVGSLSGKDLAAERIKVSVNDGAPVAAPYRGILNNNKTQIDTGTTTTIEGATKSIKFKLDLSDTTYQGESANLITDILGALTTSLQNADYQTNITLSLSTI